MTVGSFGEHLRREREMRGISLDEIVATTKIGRRLLVALEAEQFELLPGGIFNKSYVRAYAKCVGMDEDEAVAEYLQAAHETPPDTRVIAQQHASIHSNRPHQGSGFPIMPVLILLVVVAGGIGGWKVYQDRLLGRQKREALPAESSSPGPTATVPAASNSQPASSVAAAPQSAPPAAANSTVQAASPAPKPTEPAESATGQPATTNSSAAASAADTPFEVTVRPKEAAWVSIKSDGQYVVRGIIRPPDVKTIRATNQVVFFTGNAGAVEVTFNGKSVPLTGGANQEQVLVFDSRGVSPKTPSKTGAQ